MMVDGSELILLNLSTMKKIEYPCEYGNIVKWKHRICVLPKNAGRNVPILICFDFERNEKRILEYGALGAETINNIYEADCGTIIEGEKSNLYHVDDLWKIMKFQEAIKIKEI